MFFSRIRLLAFAAPAAVLVIGVAAACGGGDDDSTGDDDAQEPTSQATTAAPSGGGASGDPISIVMTDNAFGTKEITVPVNTPVEITVENTGAAVHNMHVLSSAKEGKDFTSDQLVNPGASSTFEVEFANTGTYDFQCDFHLPDMAGTITVQ